MALSGRISLNSLRNATRTSNVALMSTKAAGDNYNVLEHRNNEIVCTEFRSRNPRNLEFMQLAYKTKGYQLDKPGREFWNKLVVKPSHNFVKAEILHASGTIVTSASSAEWGIKKQLYRYTDSCAYKAVGAALALRALECGITNVYCNVNPEAESKLALFLDAFKAGGVSLEENPRYHKPDPFMKIQQTPPWEDLKLV